MSDVLDGELEKEFENGRLLRLLLKLGVINERPEVCKIAVVRWYCDLSNRCTRTLGGRRLVTGTC